jgi:hypothetical protein
MAMQVITQNWALVAASVLGTAILLFVLYRLYEASPRGRLRVQLATLRQCQAEAARLEARLTRASEQLAALRARSESTKPRLLSEAEEAVQDAQALKKIAADQVLRAKKQLRDVILEEFAPNRQDELRSKYL